MNPRILETARIMLERAKRAKVPPTWAAVVEGVLAGNCSPDLKANALATTLLDRRSELIRDVTQEYKTWPLDLMPDELGNLNARLDRATREIRDIERITGCKPWAGPRGFALRDGRKCVGMPSRRLHPKSLWREFALGPSMRFLAELEAEFGQAGATEPGEEQAHAERGPNRSGSPTPGTEDGPSVGPKR